MALHFFEHSNNKLYLQGIAKQPTFLWDISERLLQAENNVLAALNKDQDSVPIFTGVEHLPALQKLWPEHRQLIVVEKSSLLIQFYQEHKLVDLNLTKNKILIQGDLGFISCQANVVHQKSQLMQELTKLALQLYPIISSINNVDIKTYFLKHCSLDAIYPSHLLHVYALVMHAQQFHKQNRPIYDTIKQNHKQQNYIQFLMNETELAQADKADLYPEGFFKNFQRINLVYGGNNWQPIEQRLFAFGLCTSLKDSQKYFEPFTDKAKNILDVISQYCPSYLVWRNRIIFDFLEDLLFVEMMFHQLEIPCIQYYGDLYTENTMEWAGAWTYFLSRDYLAVSHKYTLGPISILDQWYGLNNNTYRTYPIRYPQQLFTMLSPQINVDALRYDAVVIQAGPAQRNKLSLPNEFFYLLKQYSSYEIGKTISCYIESLRAYFLKNYSACFFYDAQININALSHALTSVCRVDRVLDCIPVLASYRTKLFGNWEPFCPSLMYGGILQGSDAVRNTFNRSLVAVFSQHTVSTEIVHHSIVNAINAGCLPVAYRPSFEVGPASTYPFFNGDCIPYFSHPQELDHLLQSLKNNFTFRNQLIYQMQNTWMQQLKNFKSDETIAQFLKKTGPHYDAQVNLVFCKDIHIEKMLLEIGVAWILYIWGYDQHALSILFPILKSEILKNGFLYLRGLQIAKNLEDHKTANLIAKIGNKLFPEEKVFANELAGLPWEDILSPLRCLTTYPGFDCQ